jgi:hypothetical protein
MRRSGRTWSRTLVRRGLVVALTVLALALSGLVTAGGQSLALKTTAALIGSSSQLSVSEAISPTNKSVNVAARGPNNSLMFYWETGGSWYGPLGLGGPNTTFSAPSIAAEPNGNFDIAVEGPGNSMYFYWDASGTWYGPLGIGAAGSTYSAPSMVVDADGHLALAAQGPSNTLYTYWNLSGTWYGPLGIGGVNTAHSAPNLSVESCGSGCHYLYAYAVGPNNDMREWDRSNTNPWAGPREWSNDGTAYSTASAYYGMSTFEGVNHSLVWSDGYDQAVQIATAGRVYSAPSLTGLITEERLTAQGPSNSLYFWFGGSGGGGWSGPAQVGGPGTTFSAPSMAEETPGGNIDLAVQGPNNSIYFYWNLGGPWYGPLQVAGAGSAFSSPN